MNSLEQKRMQQSQAAFGGSNHYFCLDENGQNQKDFLIGVSIKRVTKYWVNRRKRKESCTDALFPNHRAPGAANRISPSG
jgi:hypothetical protein